MFCNNLFTLYAWVTSPAVLAVLVAMLTGYRRVPYRHPLVKLPGPWTGKFSSLDICFALGKEICISTSGDVIINIVLFPNMFPWQCMLNVATQDLW